MNGFITVSKKLIPGYGRRCKDLTSLQLLIPSNRRVIILGTQVKTKDYLIIDSMKKPKNNDFVYHEHSIRKLIIKKGVCYLQLMSNIKAPPIILAKEDLQKNIRGVVIKVFSNPV